MDPYGLADWPTALHLMRTKGPEEVVRRVREVESGAHGSDDATVAFCDLRGSSHAVEDDRQEEAR